MQFVGTTLHVLHELLHCVQTFEEAKVPLGHDETQLPCERFSAPPHVEQFEEAGPEQVAHDESHGAHVPLLLNWLAGQFETH